MYELCFNEGSVASVTLTLSFPKGTGLLVTTVQPGGMHEGIQVTEGSPSEVRDMGLGHRVI
jgi:hypothetical protein